MDRNKFFISTQLYFAKRISIHFDVFQPISIPILNIFRKLRLFHRKHMHAKQQHYC
jgi:hypothetical protein